MTNDIRQEFTMIIEKLLKIEDKNFNAAQLQIYNMKLLCQLTLIMFSNPSCYAQDLVQVNMME